MIEYDRTLMQRLASDLYRQAEITVVSYVVGGAVLGAALGYLARTFLPGDESTHMVLFLVPIAMGIGAGIFFSSGTAFTLRLQAQTALCQVQMEDNLRRLLEVLEARGGLPSLKEQRPGGPPRGKA